MTTQSVHIKLDHNTYLKAKTAKINISGTCNGLLTNFLQSKGDDYAEIEDLQEELKRIIDKKEHYDQKMSILSVKLQQAQEKKMKEDTEKFQNAMKVDKALKNMGVLEEVVK